MKIGYQGTKGAYSDHAVKIFADEFDYKYESIGYENFNDVVEALRMDEINYAILPIENNTSGEVKQSLEAILKSRVWINAIWSLALPVQHCLIGKEGLNVDEIVEVYSHPKALEQCSVYTSKMQEKGVKVTASYDTAGAVEMISKSEKIEAAIASKYAAELYGLSVLDSNISNGEKNATRFMAFSKYPNAEKMDESLILFQTKHKPNALYSALGCFAKQDINLLDIQKTWVQANGEGIAPVFFLEVNAGRYDSKLLKSLDDLQHIATNVTLLGSYNSIKRDEYVSGMLHI